MPIHFYYLSLNYRGKILLNYLLKKDFITHIKNKLYNEGIKHLYLDSKYCL